MDRERFDLLARLFATKQSRRGALGALLGVALLGHEPEESDGKKKKKGKGKKGKGGAANAANGRAEAQQRAAGRRCCGTKSCTKPKAGGNSYECDFAGQNLSGGDYTGANFGKIDGRGTNFDNAKVRGANFGSACLQNATFRGADVSSSNFGKACLFGADFTGAKNLNVSVKFSTALLCDTKLADGSVSNRDCNSATACCGGCSSHGDCGSGKVCCNGRCKSGDCCGNGDCPANKPICDNNTCKPCANHSQCGNGRVCCDGVCCANGEVCDGGDECCEPDPKPETCHNKCGKVVNNCGQEEHCGDCAVKTCQTGVCDPKDATCGYTPVVGTKGPNCETVCCTGADGKPVCCDRGSSCDGDGSCPDPCDDRTCANGCCANGQCKSGDTDEFCGDNGEACERCVAPKVCFHRECCTPDSEEKTCQGRCGKVVNNCGQEKNCGNCPVKTCKSGVCDGNDGTCDYTPVFNDTGPNCGTVCCKNDAGGPVCCGQGAHCTRDGKCPCATNADCGSGQICCNATCIPNTLCCEGDPHTCPDPGVCQERGCNDEGECDPEPKQNTSPCETGAGKGVCCAGACQVGDECCGDDGCDPDQTCLDGQCCADNNVCGEICLEGPCDGDACLVCNPAEGECVSDCDPAHCQVCDGEGNCVVCPDGGTCDGGRCVGVCGADTCDDTEICCRETCLDCPQEWSNRTKLEGNPRLCSGGARVNPVAGQCRILTRSCPGGGTCQIEYCFSANGKELSFRPVDGQRPCSVGQVVVKGGPNAFHYTFGATGAACAEGLVSPLNRGGNVPQISHVDFCAIGCC